MRHLSILEIESVIRWRFLNQKSFGDYTLFRKKKKKNLNNREEERDGEERDESRK